MKRIVFFSGGSALAATARQFAIRGYPATYIITTFDSGGSTQALRKVFDMPAVGDLRNRLLAAACPAAATTVKLLKRRINPDFDLFQAKEELFCILDCQDWSGLDSGAEIHEDLQAFIRAMPEAFDPRNASIGNLVLTGAWLRFGRNLTAALERYGRLLRISGHILPITEEPLHMGAELADGRIVIGQHILNKNGTCKIKRIFLTRRSPWESGSCAEIRAMAGEAALAAIMNADLLVYSMGSFYSSIVVNLLLDGVREAINRCRGLKIYIPNTGVDPESEGLDICGQVAMILKTLGAGANCGQTHALDLVLTDRANGDYPGGSGQTTQEALTNLGIRLIDAPLVTSKGLHDPVALLEMLDRLG